MRFRIRVASRSKDALAVTQIVEEVFRDLKTFITDSGTEFTSKEIKTMSYNRGILYHLVSPRLTSRKSENQTTK